jgi:hypothetical protein
VLLDVGAVNAANLDNIYIYMWRWIQKTKRREEKREKTDVERMT